jgi:hypothetical protein
MHTHATDPVILEYPYITKPIPSHLDRRLVRQDLPVGISEGKPGIKCFVIEITGLLQNGTLEQHEHNLSGTTRVLCAAV